VPASGVGPGSDDGDASREPIAIGQSFLSTALSRETPALSVTVRVLGPDGRPSAEHSFAGVLSPQARNSDVTATPVLRRIVAQVFDALGSTPDSYSGQRAMELLATYPRAEMFWASRDQVLEVVSGQLQLASRRRLRVFLQPDPQGRFMSALVFLPRDRYTTARRLAMQSVLLDAFGGSDIQYTARIGDSQLAAVHFTVTTDPAHPVAVDVDALTARLRETIRSWEDRLLTTVVGGEEDLDTATAVSRYGTAFDEAYKEAYTVEDAVVDLKRVDDLTGPDDLALAIIAPPDAAPGEYRLKLYVAGSVVTLSRALPVLQQMGTEIIDERPFDVRRSDGTPAHIYDFGLRLPTDLVPDDPGELDDLRTRFADAFVATWRGQAEVDGFNALVIAAGLRWREVAVLRAYAKYLRQIGSAYTQGYLEQVLAGYPGITANLAALFATRFDPAVPDDQRERACADLAASITADLDAVSSLDADRILRGYLADDSARP
jgi:glutamate dehydrogenase